MQAPYRYFSGVAKVLEMMKWVEAEASFPLNLPPLAHLRDEDKGEYRRQVRGQGTRRRLDCSARHARAAESPSMRLWSPSRRSALTLRRRRRRLPLSPGWWPRQVAEREAAMSSQREAQAVKEKAEARRQAERRAARNAKEAAAAAAVAAAAAGPGASVQEEKVAGGEKSGRPATTKKKGKGSKAKRAREKAKSEL